VVYLDVVCTPVYPSLQSSLVSVLQVLCQSEFWYPNLIWVQTRASKIAKFCKTVTKIIAKLRYGTTVQILLFFSLLPKITLLRCGMSHFFELTWNSLNIIIQNLTCPIMYIKDKIVTLYWWNINVLNGVNRVDFRTWDFMQNKHNQIGVRYIEGQNCPKAHGWL